MSIFIQLSPQKIDVNFWLDQVKSNLSGAIAVFLGVVREKSNPDAFLSKIPSSFSSFADENFSTSSKQKTEPAKVIFLVYEAYEEMAKDLLCSVAEKVLEDYQGLNLAIVHRLGKVQVGEVSLLLSFSSYQSSLAFEGVAFCLKEIKKSIPIWKKEFFDNGEVFWVENAIK